MSKAKKEKKTATTSTTKKRKKTKLAEDVVSDELLEQKNSLNYETSNGLIRLLFDTKAEGFLLEKTANQPIFICKRTDKVVDGLINRNFLSVPVVLDDDRYYGFLDMADIVKYIVEHFGGKEIGKQDKDFWKLVDESSAFQNKLVKDLMQFPRSARNPFHPITLGYSALCVIEALAKEPGLHRVPVVDPKSRNVVNLITQSSVITFLADNIELVGPKRVKTLGECSALFRNVISCTDQEPAITAFNKMITNDITGLAIVDEKSGKMKGNLSIRDLKTLSPDVRLFWRLDQKCKNFIKKLDKDYAEFHKRPRGGAITATRDTTIGTVIRTLNKHGIHRLYIVDSDRKPIGLVTLKDLLLELITEPENRVKQMIEAEKKKVTTKPETELEANPEIETEMKDVPIISEMTTTTTTTMVETSKKMDIYTTTTKTVSTTPPPPMTMQLPSLPEIPMLTSDSMASASSIASSSSLSAPTATSTMASPLSTSAPSLASSSMSDTSSVSQATTTVPPTKPAPLDASKSQQQQQMQVESPLKQQTVG